jgi:predicted hotdog family 3-hydroxylacyl-ACP dehydratase
MKDGGGIIHREELSSLIPHKGNIVLLSRLVSWDTEKRLLRSEYDITEECIFYDPALGGVPSWAAFELMAQSISALSGLIGREEGRSPRIGFILSVSGLELYLPVFKKGGAALIEVREECQIDRLFTFNCEVSFREGASPDCSVSAAAKLTVMEVEDVPAAEKEFPKM